jgi:hypothetical protein
MSIARQHPEISGDLKQASETGIAGPESRSACGALW